MVQELGIKTKEKQKKLVLKFHPKCINSDSQYKRFGVKHCLSFIQNR